jgi:hypothetical protein
MSASPVNYYTILGVAPHAEDIVIRAAYRALMQRHHPDKNIDLATSFAQGQASKKILAIQEAFKTLSNPELRRAYDQQMGVRALNVLRVPNPSMMERTGLDPQRLHSQDTRTWQSLLNENPRFAEHFMRLTKSHPKLAQEYKTLLLELIAERVMAKVIERLSQEFDSTNIIDSAASANDSHTP